MNFKDTVIECYKNKEFIKEFDRLNSTSLLKVRTPIEAMIDGATGYQDMEIIKFIKFVECFVWNPIVKKKDLKK